MQRPLDLPLTKAMICVRMAKRGQVGMEGVQTGLGTSMLTGGDFTSLRSCRESPTPKVLRTAVAEARSPPPLRSGKASTSTRRCSSVAEDWTWRMTAHTLSPRIGL